MVYTPIANEKIISPLKNFLRRAILDITGEEISCMDLGPSSYMLSCISHKIASETHLDSCDVAQWISTAIKEYWVTTEMNRVTHIS